MKLTSADISYIIKESVKRIVSENNFSNNLDRLRAQFYVAGKRKGLSGQQLSDFVREKMSERMAKDAALSDFSKDLRNEHPVSGDYWEDEFYSHSRDMADSWGFETDPYVDDDED